MWASEHAERVKPSGQLCEPENTLKGLNAVVSTVGQQTRLKG